MTSFVVEQIWGGFPPSLQAVILVFLMLSYAAGHLISNTPTPAPNTIWGRLYTGLEIFAGFYNRAKDIGIPVPEKPSVGDLLARIQELESSLQTQQQDKRSVPLPQAAIAVPVPVPTFPPILEQSNA